VSGFYFEVQFVGRFYLASPLLGSSIVFSLAFNGESNDVNKHFLHIISYLFISHSKSKSLMPKLPYSLQNYMRVAFKFQVNVLNREFQARNELD
jgi:hypothetical protein